MLDAPRIVRSEEQRAAVIHLTIPRDQITQVMGPALGELLSTVAAQGLVPAGPVFSHHFRRDPASFDFEVGVPLDAEITATGRVRPGILPGATVARAVHHGGYEGLAGAWGELESWLTAVGRTPGDGFWERYLAGPESSADPADWRTELSWTVR